MTGTAAATAGTEEKTGSTVLPAVVAGLMAGAVAVVATVAEAAFIFGGPLESHIGLGVSLALVSSIIAAAVMAVTSSLPGMIGATQGVTAAILSVMASAIVTSLGDTADEAVVLATVVVGIGTASLLTGLILFGLGQFRLGNAVRLIPFPVLAGFLAGSGWLLAGGSVEVITGGPMGLADLASAGHQQVLFKFALAMAFIAVISFFAQSSFARLALPAAVIVASLLFHGLAAVAGLSVADLSAADWIFTLTDRPQPWPPMDMADFALVNWTEIARQLPLMLALAVVAAGSLLMNANGLELALARDLDFDRELKAAGASCAVAGVAGGPPGFQDLGITMLAQALRGGRRIAGLAAGAVCLAVLVFGFPLLSLVPRPLFGALLLWVGANLILDWGILTAWRVKPLEYAVILGMVAVTATGGPLMAIGFGLAAGLVLFIIDYSRVEIISAELSGIELRSRVDRPAAQRSHLDQHGGAIRVIRLQGYLFFGTADGLRQTLAERLAMEAEGTAPRFLILDFRRVSGVDSSAAASFHKLERLVQERGLSLILTSVSPAIRRTLARGGLTYGPDETAHVLPDLDHGLEWCEDRLLADVSESSDGKGSLAALLATIFPDAVEAERFAKRLAPVSFAEGEALIGQGSASDDIVLVETGHAAVTVTGITDQPLRIGTVGPGSFVGEVSYYHGGPRLASVTATGPVSAWRVSRADLDTLEQEDAALALRFHTGMAAILAARLASTNRLIRTLLD